MSNDGAPAAPGPEPHVHTLDDGARVQVRPLVPDDRAELAVRYGQLSSKSRRLRFVSAPSQLSDRLLDHLLDVDGVDRVALVATLIDEPGTPSVGIARYLRSRSDPAAADAAVTVADGFHRRGIGTLLLMSLVAAAMDNGIDTFTADVLWDNRDLLDGLRAVGAEVAAGEPGLASVRVDLPPDPKSLRGTTVHGVMRVAGAVDPTPA